MNELINVFDKVLSSYPNLTYHQDRQYIKIYYCDEIIGVYRIIDNDLLIDSYDEHYRKIIHDIIDKVNKDLILNSDLTDSISKEQLTNPPRYATQSGKQLIELLRDDLLTKEEYIGFLKGNLYKYVFRYQSKGGLDDLKKAQYYLEELQKIVGDVNE